MQTVKILNLTKSFGKIRAVDSLSLDIEKGKITGLIGADGSGKTTLIRLITGLLIPDGGEITVLWHKKKNYQQKSDICRKNSDYMKI